MSDAVDLRELLTIDIAAELRKLTTAQLQGPWQLPAELVRRAFAAGARTVEVELPRGGLRVRDDGAPIERSQLLALAELLDPGAPAERRHRALLALEAAGSLALLALPALGATRVEVTSRGDGLVRRIEISGHGRCDLHEGTDPERGRGTAFALHGAELDASRARSYLADVARFAPGAVRVDGTALPEGLRGYLAGRELALPQHRLRGHVMLGHRGEQARVWLLVHGVVTTHVGVARSPCFEAVVELGDKIAAGELSVNATAADLREALAPALEALVDAGVRLMLSVGAQAASVPATSQARVLHLLLQALRSRRRVQEVLAVPIVPALVGRSERRFLPLSALEGLARREAAFALDPAQDPEAFALPDAPVLLLGTAERGALAELLSLRFRPPPPRGDDRLPLSASLRRGLTRLVQGLRGAGRPLPESALTAAEQQFLAAMRAAARGGSRAPERIELCAGRGAPRIAGTPPALFLGREHPDVRAAVAAAEHGEVWLYPACVALFGGQALPGTAARATWVRTWFDAARK